MENGPHKQAWLVAHAYSSLEYDQNDLFSLYSACRTINRLDPTRLSYADLFLGNYVTRSQVRDTLFRLMFAYLWENLRQFCSNTDTDNIWIHSYTFISRYYPSEKVLQRVQLLEIKAQIEFMNLAYLILLNEKTPQPKQLVSHLLNEIYFIHVNNQGFNRTSNKSIYLKLLPNIIDSVQQYLESKNVRNPTLMLDIQLWIVKILKSSAESYEEEIENLFKNFTQLSHSLSLPMKQFLFDQLANLSLQSAPVYQPTMGCWERLIQLLPLMIECIADENSLQEYRLPYHPSITKNINQRILLLDLFFFYIQRYFNDEIINCEFITKIMQSTSPNVPRRTATLVRNIFKLFKDYFLLQTNALLLCKTDFSFNLDDQEPILITTKAIIKSYLSINPEATEFTPHLHIFLSTIISKKSWNFLITLLKSEHIQRLDNQWATILCKLLERQLTGQHNDILQFCHQIQFTLSTNNTSSIFPHLHQPYQQFKQILTSCINKNAERNRWKNLSDWIQLQINANPPVLQLKEIKVMLLLIIYYDYYCTNHLSSLMTLLPFIENTLQPSPEQLRVFRVFLDPEKYMIGYRRENDDVEQNCLNKLFRIDNQEKDEIGIRHLLVNLLAMILMGGKESFLWTFTFQPLRLANTFGK